MKLRIFLTILAGLCLLALGTGAGLLLARQLANRQAGAAAIAGVSTTSPGKPLTPPTAEIQPTRTAAAIIPLSPAVSPIPDTPAPTETALPVTVVTASTPPLSGFPVISASNAASLVPVGQMKVDPIDQANYTILSGYISQFRWLPDGQGLAFLAEHLAIFDVSSGQVTRTYSLPDYDTTRIISFDIHPSGQVAALGTESGQILFLDLASGNVTAGWPAGAPMTVLRFSPDGSLLVAFSAGNTGSQTVDFWTYPEGAVLQPLTSQALEKAGGYRSVSFTADGKRVALAGAGKIHVWDVPAQVYYHTVPGALNVYATAYAPDGSTLAWSGVAWQVTVQEMNEDRWYLSKTIPAANAIWGLAYSPDGSLLAGASQSWDGKAAVTLWSVADWTEIHQLPDQVFSLTWSSDGTLLATTSAEGLTVWGVK